MERVTRPGGGESATSREAASPDNTASCSLRLFFSGILTNFGGDVTSIRALDVLSFVPEDVVTSLEPALVRAFFGGMRRNRT